MSFLLYKNESLFSLKAVTTKDTVETTRQQANESLYECTERNGAYAKVLYFSKHYTNNQNILHGAETTICPSLQKQYFICIKQYVHGLSV